MKGPLNDGYAEEHDLDAGCPARHPVEGADVPQGSNKMTPFLPPTFPRASSRSRPRNNHVRDTLDAAALERLRDLAAEGYWPYFEQLALGTAEDWGSIGSAVSDLSAHGIDPTNESLAGYLSCIQEEIEFAMEMLAHRIRNDLGGAIDACGTLP